MTGEKGSINWSDKTLTESMETCYVWGITGHEHMQSKFSRVFSNKPTINRHLHKLKVEPGIVEDSFKLMEIKAKSLHAKQKFASLVMDEIAIKELIEYDPSNKCLSGFITVPQGADKTVDDGNFSSDVPACNANVFMLRMISTDDKFIVSWDLTDTSFQGKSMAEKTKEIIRKAKEVGVTVVSHAQDMGSSNIAT